MADQGHEFSTETQEAIPDRDPTEDPTPGLILLYARALPDLSSIIPFVRDELSVGRERERDVCIPEAAVSRLHAKFTRRENGWWVEDCGSTNGTIVNGFRISRHRLGDHDVVRFGDTLYRFCSAGVLASVDTAARRKHGGRTRSTLASSAHIARILDQIDKIATTRLSCVVLGESGTGKELLARVIHEASGRSGRMVALNCAALSPTLIESELFGHRKGSFTGAHRDTIGLVRAAHGGTLFLDEIGDMPLEAQSKLLRVLQEQEVTPLGSTTPERIDLRVVCATHRDLPREVEAGRFRGDLLARLREFVVRIPALRERREDVVPLTRHFLEGAGTRAEPSFPAMLALLHHTWPYNVRELESALKLAVALSGSSPIALEHLPEAVRGAVVRHGQPRAEVENESTSASAPMAPSENALRDLLTRNRGNIAAASREVGKKPMQIHRWIRRYGLRIEEFREPR